MDFLAARSRQADSERAIDSLIAPLRFSLGATADLGVLFVTAHHRDAAAKMAARISESLEPRVLLGCTCEGVLGVDDEIQDGPGAVLMLGHMEGVRLSPFHIHPGEWDRLEDTPEGLMRRLGAAEDTRACLVLADPFTTPVRRMLSALHRLPPGAPAIGGMASGAARPGGNAFLLNDETYTDGVIGVTLAGAVRVQVLVSQGCRPIGRRFLVTRSHDNLIETLGGRPALHVAEETVQALPDEERCLLNGGLFLGIAINEYQEAFGRGDFLARPLIGADPERGILVVGDTVRAGQTVQFHVRDAVAAGADLRHKLHESLEGTPPAGGLLFDCCGRGVRLFNEPCHDLRTVLSYLPHLPLAGCFAAGEIAPVGGRSFLHSQIASLALFRPVP